MASRCGLPDADADADAGSGHNEARFAPLETILSSFESSRRALLHGTFQIAQFQDSRSFFDKNLFTKNIFAENIFAKNISAETRMIPGYHPNLGSRMIPDLGIILVLGI